MKSLNIAFDPGPFGGLWIDDPQAFAANIASLHDDIAAHVLKLYVDGYTIIEGAVPADVVDSIVADKELIHARGETFVLKHQGAYIDPLELERLDRAHRIVDLYAISAAARSAIANDTVTRVLQAIFQDDPIAMQSIYFEYGSQQAMHQDTAYVISPRPLNLAAAWIALEDIVEGSGELIYYPGSHRFDDFLFSDEYKHWSPNRDGPEQHQAFLKGLHEQARAKGIEQERFLARKGDILIWHADLAHGGSRITVPDQTRLSLVAHYCPRTIRPGYGDRIGDLYTEFQMENGMVFTSRHYDLKPLERGEPAILAYDGGVTKRRSS